MMVGYVDRMGGPRAVAWMVSATAPLLLVAIAVAPGSGSGWARALVLVFGVVSSLVSFVYFHGRLLYAHPLVIVDTVSQGPHAGQIAQTVAASRFVRRALTVLGAVVIGALGSKLADYLPFP
jgi:hypothetical protein